MVTMRQLLAGAVMAGFLSSGVAAVDRPVFKKIDQPVVWFKYDGGKYPSVIIYNPALERVNLILCGTDINGAGQAVSCPGDLEGLHALCCWTKYSESNVQLEKYAKGYRETYAARATERLLRLLGFAPTSEYKGTLLVDEYLAGMSQNWVLRSKDVPAIVNYFRNADIEPLDVKPLLLLELLDVNGVVADEDMAFLTTYFDMVAVDDQDARAFFTKADERKNDCLSATSAAHTIGATSGESIMAATVDKFDKLEVKKLLAASVLIPPMLALSPQLRTMANDAYNSEFFGPVRELLTARNIKIAAGTVAALVLAVAAYEYIEELKLNTKAVERAEAKKAKAKQAPVVA